MTKDNHFFLTHIVDAITRIGEYTAGLSIDDFLANKLIQAGVIRELEIIGEATKQINSDTKDEHPDIPWKKMAGMRDKLIHHYFEVDLMAVWNTVGREIPALKTKLLDILK